MFDFMILNNHILFITAINLISQLISLARWTAINVLANYFEFMTHKDVGLFRKPWVICIMKSLTQSYHFFLFCRFFGQEPPMMKVFLKELGYEVREIYWRTTVPSTRMTLECVVTLDTCVMLSRNVFEKKRA